MPKAPKNTVQNDKIINSRSQNKPLPLAGGGGVGSQHPSKVFRTQAKSRANFNKNERNPPAADFFLNVPRSGTYRDGEADISYEIYRAEGISRAEGTKKHCSER